MRWNTGLAFICSLNGSVTVWGEACVFIPGTTELTLSWKRAFCLRENLEGRLSVFGVAVHKTGSVVIYPANSHADLAPQSRSRALSAPAAGPDLSEVVYPGNLMTFSQDAPLINSNNCSRHNLVVYGKPQMPATGKCISKIQCVHGTAVAEGWCESTHATRLQCIVLREADTHKMPWHTECTVGCLERRAGKKERKSEHIGVSIERNENVLEKGHGDKTLLCE